jgi:hypothetical protein
MRKPGLQRRCATVYPERALDVLVPEVPEMIFADDE